MLTRFKSSRPGLRFRIDPSTPKLKGLSASIPGVSHFAEPSSKSRSFRQSVFRRSPQPIVPLIDRQFKMARQR